MKFAVALLLLVAAFCLVAGLPSASNSKGSDGAAMQRSSYGYFMCHMECKRSCWDQGYWAGHCENFQCICNAPRGF